MASLCFAKGIFSPMETQGCLVLGWGCVEIFCLVGLHGSSWSCRVNAACCLALKGRQVGVHQQHSSLPGDTGSFCGELREETRWHNKHHFWSHWTKLRNQSYKKQVYKTSKILQILWCTLLHHTNPELPKILEIRAGGQTSRFYRKIYFGKAKKLQRKMLTKDKETGLGQTLTLLRKGTDTFTANKVASQLTKKWLNRFNRWIISYIKLPITINIVDSWSSIALVVGHPRAMFSHTSWFLT